MFTAVGSFNASRELGSPPGPIPDRGVCITEVIAVEFAAQEHTSLVAVPRASSDNLVTAVG